MAEGKEVATGSGAVMACSSAARVHMALIVVPFLALCNEMLELCPVGKLVLWLSKSIKLETRHALDTHSQRYLGEVWFALLDVGPISRITHDRVYAVSDKHVRMLRRKKLPFELVETPNGPMPRKRHA